MKTIINRTISLAIGLAALSGPIWADTHYVDISNTTPTAPYTNAATAATDIQAAVNAAGNGDTVLVADGVYMITSTLLINKSLNVQSVNGADTTIIDANNQCRVIRIPAHSGPCSLRGLTIRGGHVGGGAAGIWLDGNGPAVIEQCVFEHNTSTRNAGGMSIKTSAGQSTVATLRKCVFLQNEAGANGGGFYVNIPSTATAEIIVEDCDFSENSAGTDGGGIWCSAPNGSLHISGCLIQSNAAAGNGGGIRLMYNSLLTDSLLIGNQAGNRGGGEHGGLQGNSYIVNCTIVDNEAPLGGGVSRSTVMNSIVFGNRADTRPDLTTDAEVAFTCSSNLTDGVNGNITADPQFVDASSGDYRLLATSPCIDAGTNAFVLSSVDLAGMPRIEDGNFDGQAVVDMGACEFRIIPVVIDVKPGSNTNPINLKSRGCTLVAVLTTDEFDTAQVDHNSVRAAGATPLFACRWDGDWDGDKDLILLFRTRHFNLTQNSTELTLIGQTHNGELIQGTDVIKIVPPQKQRWCPPRRTQRKHRRK